MEFFTIRIPKPPKWASIWMRWLLPTPGNVIFTILAVCSLFWATSVGALPATLPFTTNASIGTIAYQGRLADSSGNPVTATVPMVFRLYNIATGSTSLWEEAWTGSNSVRVSDGLFNVMLGSLVAIPQNIVTSNSNLWLGITVNTDNEMQPRVQLGSVPFAVQALTVPDGSITAAKLAPDVSLLPPDGSITTAKLTDGAVTSRKARLQVGYIAGLSQSYPLNSNDLVLPGTEVTLNIETPSTVIINASFDFGLGTGAKVIGNVRVDGTPVNQHAIFQGSALRTTAAVNVLVNLDPGTHTISLQAKLLSGTGGSVEAHTGYTYLVVAR